jgi:hypothetical protein
MHDEVIIEHHARALLQKATSVHDAATIWDVASLCIKPLSGVVARMQSNCDTNTTGIAGCFRFCAVK